MTRVVVPPITAEIDGARVHILEVTEHEWVDKRKHYIVTCFIELGGYRSGVFSLDVTSNEELKEKLRIEIAKMKLMLMAGRTELFSKQS